MKLKPGKHTVILKNGRWTADTGAYEGSYDYVSSRKNEDNDEHYVITEHGEVHLFESLSEAGRFVRRNTETEYVILSHSEFYSMINTAAGFWIKHTLEQINKERDE